MYRVILQIDKNLDQGPYEAGWSYHKYGRAQAEARELHHRYPLATVIVERIGNPDKDGDPVTLEITRYNPR